MRIFSRNTLLDYCKTQRSKANYKTLESQIRAWYREAQKARWTSMADIKTRYATASVISSDRVVFNLVGNHYRLIVRIDFDWGVIRVCFIGTHKEYDNVDAKEVTLK